MVKRISSLPFMRVVLVTGFLLSLLMSPGRPAIAQQFNFEKLSGELGKYTLIMNMKLEISFGMQTNEQEQRMLATIVTEDGLVVFDGSSLEFDNPFSAFSSMTVKTKPTKIEFESLDGSTTYSGEYIGTDRYTKLGFARVVADESREFDYVKFKKNPSFKVGEWVATHILMPEYIQPPLAADVGMISSLVEAPERIPLTIGFGSMEVASILYSENHEPVGLLANLPDPSSTSADNGAMMGSMGQPEFPLLGIITAEKINELIADPPVKGKIERGWLGITLQALTPDIQEFFGLDVEGGIVVNEVMRNSPADQSGLKVGDIILSVNDEPVTVDAEEKLPVFQRKISEMGPEAQIEFMVARPNGDVTDTVMLNTTLGQAPIAATDAEEFESDALEMKVRDLVFSDYMLYNQDEDTFNGVVVSELEQGGLANVGGLQLGDVVQRIGSQEVESVVDAERVIDEIVARKPAEVIFFVWRNNKTMFVNVKTDWAE